MTTTATPQILDLSRAELVDVFASWLEAFARGVEARSAVDLEGSFSPDATWRDFMAFSWDFTHVVGRDDLVDRFLAAAQLHDARGFVPTPHQEPVVLDGGIAAFFDFTTHDRIDSGYVRLVVDGGRIVAESLETQVDGLSAHPALVEGNRPHGKVYGIVPNRTRWSDERTREAAFDDQEPTVIVLGAGHNGLAIAARLKTLGVPTLVIDREARVGDTWRKRYPSLALHSIVRGDELPYMPLPATWTAHTPKDKWADWLESYARTMDLNVWTSTTFVDADYDDDAERWTVHLRRGDGSIRELHPRHFVVAGGLFGGPKVPKVEGIESFRGEAVHSGEFQGGAEYAGKRAIVVGSGVSGHELAHDLYEHGADVTMVQRSATYVISFDANHKYLNPFYVEGATLPLEFADKIANALPNVRVDEVQKQLVQLAKAEDQDLLDRLEARGFKLEWGPDGTGIIGLHMAGRDSYQIDIGASQLIADGEIHLKQGVELASITNGDTVVFSDGSELQADLIVFATGYHQLWGHMGPTLGAAAAKIDYAYGRAADGEYANTWRRSAQPGLWFATGFIRMARFYTKFTSLLIAAIEDGIEPRDPSRDPRS